MSLQNEQSGGTKVLSLFFDDGVYTEIDPFITSKDEKEAVAAYGKVDGNPVYAFSQNSGENGGIMSKAQGAKLLKLYELAAKTGAPVLGIYDSKGAYLDEGMEMLSSYGDILKAINNLSGVVPQVSVILGSCTGTNALNAISADFVIMADDAKLSTETSGENSSADYAASQGIAHIRVSNVEGAADKARKLISMLPSNNLSPAPVWDSAEPEKNDISAEAIASVFDAESFIEIMDGAAKRVKTCFARLCGKTVGILATNGEVICDKTCEKMARFVKFCDAFSIPIITFGNSKGFAGTIQAKKLTSAYADATTAKITVVTGEAFGPFYLATCGTGAGADMTFAWDSASVSPLSPQAQAIIMWKDKMNVAVAKQQEVVEQYKKTELTAIKAAQTGIVQDVFAKEQTRQKLCAALEMLAGKRVATVAKKHSTI